MPLRVLDSPYREITKPILDYVRDIRRRSPRDVVTVYIPEYVVGRWWEQILHNQSALRLKGRLLFTPGVMVTSVPFQLRSSAAAEQRAERDQFYASRIRRGPRDHRARSRDRRAASAEPLRLAPTTRWSARPSRSTSARSPTVGTTSHGTRAGWSSSGTPWRASGSACCVTEGAQGARFLRGDAVEVLQPSSDAGGRAVPVRRAGPLRWLRLPARRAVGTARLKAHVVAEQLHRLAGIDRDVEVEPVPGDHDGLGWRTRVRWSATPDGRPGLLAHRSADVVAVDRCLIAHPDLPPCATPCSQAGVESASSVLSSTGERVVVTAPADRRSTVTETAAGRAWRVGAGRLLAGASWCRRDPGRRGLAARDAAPGERCWDLYAGVGLFSGVLADAVGPEGAVVAVETHRRAVGHLRDNLADQPQVRAIAERVDRFVRSRQAQGHVEVVVLDPPRAGAGKDVVRRIAARRPRVVVVRRLRPGRTGTRPRHVRRTRATAGRAARLRPVPDDPPRRVRRDAQAELRMRATTARWYAVTVLHGSGTALGWVVTDSTTWCILISRYFRRATKET